jgi:hypothetical protein
MNFADGAATAALVDGSKRREAFEASSLWASSQRSMLPCFAHLLSTIAAL